jgi:pilus assembly protein CpaE
MDGITATEKICSEHPDTIVIMMSVNGENEYLRKAMVAGAKDYLVKPFGADELVETVYRCWKREWQRRVSQARPETPMEKPMGKVLTVYSPKGGVGKTTVAVNTAAALTSDRRRKVCLIDLNLYAGDVSVFLSLIPRRTISDLASEQHVDKDTFLSYLLSHPSGLKVLPAPLRPEHAEYVVVDQVTKIVNIARELFDYVVIDTPSSFQDVVISALDVADQVLLVSSMDMASLKNTKLALQVMRQLNYTDDKFTVIINKASYDCGIKFADVQPALGRAADVFIPDEPGIAVTALNRGMPFVLDQPGGKLSRKIIEMVREHIEEREDQSGGLFGWRRKRGAR